MLAQPPRPSVRRWRPNDTTTHTAYAFAIRFSSGTDQVSEAPNHVPAAALSGQRFAWKRRNSRTKAAHAVRQVNFGSTSPSAKFELCGQVWGRPCKHKPTSLKQVIPIATANK